MSTGIFPLEELDSIDIEINRTRVAIYAGPHHKHDALKAWEKLRAAGIQLLDCQAEKFGQYFSVRMNGGAKDPETRFAEYRRNKVACLDLENSTQEARDLWAATEAFDAAPTTIALAIQMAEACLKEKSCPTK